MSDTELHDVRLRRVAMRSARRGTKEMDIILSRYATDRLPNMTAAELDHYEDLLNENDQDLYAWITGQSAAPDAHVPLIAAIRDHISGN